MARTFHDLNIQSTIASGHSPVKDIIRRAEMLEIDKIGICDYLTDHDDLQRLIESIQKVETDVEVYPGVKIRADDERELNDKLAAFRDHVTLVAVHGGDSSINRAACENSRVDILSHPEFKRKDSGIDHVIAKNAANNNVAIELTFNSPLKTYGKLRAQIMHHMRRNIRLAQKYDAPLLISSGAKSIDEMRRPRDMLGLAYCLGMELSDTFKLVEQIPSSILKRAEQANKDDHIRPGHKVEESNSSEQKELGSSKNQKGDS